MKGNSLWVARVITYGLAVLAAGIVFYRWAKGLGYVTNMSDSWPWGLWIGFDLLCGVALAAGGFTTAAVVYIFHKDKYRPVARAAILTAFLGYLLVIVALLVDLGRPWAIFHMMWMWNFHSVLFEVGACVLLYTTVLALEFAPVVLEKWKQTEKIIAIIEKVKIPLVIAGIGLSSLHQSSLGSLFLSAEHRQNALWFTPMLPVNFLLSAVMVGPAMVIFESNMSSRVLGRELEADILKGLGRAMPYLIGLYLVVKLAELAVSGDIVMLGAGTTQAGMFWVEIGLLVVGLALFLVRSTRESPRGIFAAGVAVVLGVVVNRLNVCLVSMPDLVENVPYFPSWQEFAVTLGVLSGGVIVFGYVTKYFNVFGEPDAHATR